MRVHSLTSGRIVFDGRDITKLSLGAMRPLAREMQMIFQDPYGSLNPRRRIRSIIGDPFSIHGVADGLERRRRVEELMSLVGLNPRDYDQFPAEILRGPTATHRDCSGAGAAPEANRLRRTGFRARRLYSGTDYQLAFEASGGFWAELHILRARPVCGTPCESSSGGDVPGQSGQGSRRLISCTAVHSTHTPMLC